jgi:hypothetical protein
MGVEPQVAILLLLAVAAMAVFDQDRPDFRLKELRLLGGRLSG